MAIFTNQATLTYGGTQVLSNVTTGQILESLTVRKTSLESEYAAGEKITYVVTLQNTGTVPLQGLTLEDDLGGYQGAGGTLYPLTYETGSLFVLNDGAEEKSAAVADEQPLTVTGISVPAGSTAVIIYAANVNGYAPLDTGSQIINTVTVSGDGLAEPVTADFTLTVSEAPLLTVEKTLSPLSVTPGQSITYTFTVRNYGNAPADEETGATITDAVNPVLTDVTVTYNGAAWAEGGGYTYDTSTGAFSTTPGALTVPPAEFTVAPDGQITTDPGVAVITLQGTVG